mmetsp:Transcript_92424/g.266855  ORF Transcript_92424/g.266855 Transcript_92424/m.266855 type:complete len:239 (+) Transcript_92424:1282-1998(+)
MDSQQHRHLDVDSGELAPCPAPHGLQPAHLPQGSEGRIQEVRHRRRRHHSHRGPRDGAHEAQRGPARGPGRRVAERLRPGGRAHKLRAAHRRAFHGLDDLGEEGGAEHPGLAAAVGALPRRGLRDRAGPNGDLAVVDRGFRGRLLPVALIAELPGAHRRDDPPGGQGLGEGRHALRGRGRGLRTRRLRQQRLRRRRARQRQQSLGAHGAATAWRQRGRRGEASDLGEGAPGLDAPPGL